MLKVSQLVGLDIYTDAAKYLGKIYDVIIDLQKGEVVRLTLEPIKVVSKEEAKQIFKEKTILYKSVKAVDKIMIVSTVQAAEENEEKAQAEVEKKPMPYSYRYKSV